MTFIIAHLHEHPWAIPTVAGWIYREFWADQPGYSEALFEGLLRQADSPDRIPLSLLALVDGQPVGTVNLIACDSQRRPDLTPWLAALVVLPEHRGRGVGSALVRALAAHAGRLGFREVYLGTDIRAFYLRLGAEGFQEIEGWLCIMRLASGSAPT
jgi:predicted N-acetyltransferase YhbS